MKIISAVLRLFLVIFAGQTNYFLFIGCEKQKRVPPL